MIVVDASVLANVVGDDTAVGERARARLAAAASASIPDLADVETVSTLRRRWLAGDLAVERCQLAIEDLLALPITRVPVGQLLHRVFELRSNVTAYDACYVALAEAMGCPLVTSDRRLANAPAITCQIEVLDR
jgi:predicted nucleic acid-binding protein